jgi:hypothetical protein
MSKHRRNDEPEEPPRSSTKESSEPMAVPVPDDPGFALLRQQFGEEPEGTLEDPPGGPVSVSIYVQDDNLSAASALIAAVSDLYSLDGVVMVADGPIVRGSWFQQFKLKFSRAVTSEESKRIIAKSEVTIQAALLDEPQSRANEHNAAAVAALVQAIRDVDSFVALTGSILITKYTDSSGKVHMRSKTLSPTEIIELERNSSTLRSPEAADQFIRMLTGNQPISSSQQSGDDEASRRLPPPQSGSVS